MTERKNAVSQLSKQRDELEQRIRERFSLFTYVLIVRFFRQRMDAQAEKTSAVHQKKLTTMGAGNQLLPCDPNKTVLNFSSISLSPRIRTLLAFGLEFCLHVHVYRLNFFAYYFKFEKMFYSLSTHSDGMNISEFKVKLQHIASKYFFNFKPYKVFSSIFKRNDIAELKNLATNKDIIICSPGKGRSVVILDRHIYEQKMLQMISDTTKYCAIKEPLITYSLRIEDRINNFLRKLKNLSLMSDDTYKKLFVSGSGLGYFIWQA